MPIAAFALFGWCMANGGGLKAMNLASESVEPSAKATPLGWSIMAGINTIFGSLSPMLVNQPDLARYCKKPRDAGVSQVFSVFFPSVLVFFMGMASTTSIQAVWGTAYWSVWDLLDAVLDHHWNAGARTGIFFIGLAFFVGIFATNLGANSIPFGSDMTGLFPKVLTIRRGQVLCAVLGVVVQPWQLMANASAFLRFVTHAKLLRNMLTPENSFLGSYNIFMAPLCAIICVDYFITRKGNIHVTSLYDGKKSGLYWFWNGINASGVIAWIVGTSMGIPGLIGEYQPGLINDAARYMYMMGWLLTFTTSATIYFGLSTFIKPQIFPTGRENTPYQREWLANDGREGFYEDEHNGGELHAPQTPPLMGGEEIQMGEKACKSDV
jgi:NCS1 family nucleobase:cation symporter-1